MILGLLVVVTAVCFVSPRIRRMAHLDKFSFCRLKPSLRNACLRFSTLRPQTDKEFLCDSSPSGLLICSLTATLRADDNDADADRFLETAKKLIQAINSDDSRAIQASFDAQMQQALPPDKATPFFRGLVTAKGKLKEAGAPQVTGPTAIVRVTAARGAWDFKISLEPSGKIAGLLITEAAAEASAPASARAHQGGQQTHSAINRDDSAAIRQSSTLRCSRHCRPTRPLPFSANLCPPKAVKESRRAKSPVPPPSCE